MASTLLGVTSPENTWAKQEATSAVSRIRRTASIVFDDSTISV